MALGPKESTVWTYPVLLDKNKNLFRLTKKEIGKENYIVNDGVFIVIWNFEEKSDEEVLEEFSEIIGNMKENVGIDQDVRIDRGGKKR